MGKPSIFSREYDRKMKARKKTKTVVAFFLIVSAVFFLGRTTYMNWRERNAESLKNGQNKGYLTEKDKGNEGKESNNDLKVGEKPVITEKVLDVKTEEGKVYKVLYTEEAGIKKIKNVISEDNSMKFFNISPSLSKVVILNAAQDMYLADLNGSVINITMPRYITQSTKKEILKTTYIQKKPEFIWHSTPKFINDNNIIYLSQVPWFKTTKYIWMVDISTLGHSRLREIEGENVILGDMEQKGLKVTVESAIKYIDIQGNVIQ